MSKKNVVIKTKFNGFKGIDNGKGGWKVSLPRYIIESQPDSIGL